MSKFYPNQFNTFRVSNDAGVTSSCIGTYRKERTELIIVLNHIIPVLQFFVPFLQRKFILCLLVITILKRTKANQGVGFLSLIPLYYFIKFSCCCRPSIFVDIPKKNKSRKNFETKRIVANLVLSRHRLPIGF